LKALEYELVDIDKNWNEKIYKLIQKTQDDKLRPKQPITKEDFLYIAYVAMKANSCILKENYKLWLEMQIFPKTCNEANLNSCELSNLIWNEKVFDFFGKVWLSPWDSVTNASQYSWRFYDYSNWNEILKYWKYLDDYDFENNWKYRVYLRVISDKWLVGEVYNDINIWDKSTVKDTKKVSIKADPIIWYAPLIVTFNSIVSPISNNNSYFWNFWDSSTWVWKNIIHTFKEPWVYKVILKVTDNEGYEDEASVLIYVMDLDTDGDWIIDIEDACPTVPWKAENKWCPDTDGDWVIDTEDVCPTILWKIENKWCPIFDETCRSDTDCKDGYYCSSWICSPKQVVVNCEYSGWDLITWNVVCNSCPCSSAIDFSSNIRKCDVVFPAIISPDGTTIYWKWNYFKVE
jgi:hypothetical protein